MKNKRSRKPVTGQQRRESARRRATVGRRGSYDVLVDDFVSDLPVMAERRGLDPTDRGTVSMGLEGFDGSDAEFEALVARAAAKGVQLRRITTEEFRQRMKEADDQGRPQMPSSLSGFVSVDVFSGR